MNRNDQQPPAGEDGDRPTGTPARRPYRTPELKSFPLFERMALACTPILKGSGEDDES